MDKEQSTPTIKKFKKIVTITFLLGLIGVGLGVFLRSISFDVDSCPPYAVIGSGLLLVIIVCYILSLIYLYKTTKILKLAGKMNVKPALILLLTLLSTPILFLIPIIVFVVIWQKADAYLKGD